MWRYKVYIYNIDDDETNLFYTPASDSLILTEANLSLGVGEVGTFTFKVTKEHPYYDLLIPYTVILEVQDNVSEYPKLFRGRLITVKENIYGERECECEGRGSWLDDVVIPYYLSNDVTNLEDWLTSLITVHNQSYSADNTSEEGLLSLGTVENVTFSTRVLYWEYGTTKDALDGIISEFGGYYQIDAYGKLNYFQDGADADLNTQEIRFGNNMVDYALETDKSEIYSRVYPYGARFHEFDESYETEDDNVDSYHTRVALDSTGTGLTEAYVQNDYLVSLVGVKSTYVIDDNIMGYDEDDPDGLTTCADKLYNLAVSKLSEMQLKTVALKVSAVDLSLIDSSLTPFRITERVRVRCLPTDLDIILPVTNVNINLLNPSENTYELGNTYYTGLTGQIRR